MIPRPPTVTQSLTSLKNFKIDRPDQLKQTADGIVQSFIKFETDLYKGNGLLKLYYKDTTQLITSSSPSGKAFLFFVRALILSFYFNHVD